MAEGDEKERERESEMNGKREREEWNRDHNTSEMSPMCLAVAAELQGTAVTQEEAMWRVGGNDVNIKSFF